MSLSPAGQAHFLQQLLILGLCLAWWVAILSGAVGYLFWRAWR